MIPDSRGSSKRHFVHRPHRSSEAVCAQQGHISYVEQGAKKQHGPNKFCSTIKNITTVANCGYHVWCFRQTAGNWWLHLSACHLIGVRLLFFLILWYSLGRQTLHLLCWSSGPVDEAVQCFISWFQELVFGFFTMFENLDFLAQQSDAFSNLRCWFLIQNC